MIISTNVHLWMVRGYLSRRDVKAKSLRRLTFLQETIVCRFLRQVLHAMLAKACGVTVQGYAQTCPHNPWTTPLKTLLLLHQILFEIINAISI